MEYPVYPNWGARTSIFPGRGTGTPPMTSGWGMGTPSAPTGQWGPPFPLVRVGGTPSALTGEQKCPLSPTGVQGQPPPPHFSWSGWGDRPFSPAMGNEGTQFCLLHRGEGDPLLPPVRVQGPLCAPDRVGGALFVPNGVGVPPLPITGVWGALFPPQWRAGTLVSPIWGTRTPCLPQLGCRDLHI